MRHRTIVAFLCSALAGNAADHQLWTALFNEATRLNNSGQYQAAEGPARRALKEAELFGAGDVRVAYSLRELGVVHQYQARLQEAEKLFRRGIHILETDAPGHHLALALLYTDLATLFGLTFRWTQAEKPLRTALDLKESVFGPVTPEVAKAQVNLAGVLTRKGDLKGAREMLEKAIKVAEECKETAPLMASALNALGVLLISEKKVTESLIYLERAAETWRKSGVGSHPDLIPPLLNAGRAYLELHRAAEALPLLREAQAIAEARLGATHPLLAEVLFTSAAALGKTGERKQAREMEKRSQSIFKLYPERTATVSLAALAPKR